MFLAQEFKDLLFTSETFQNKTKTTTVLHLRNNSFFPLGLLNKACCKVSPLLLGLRSFDSNALCAVHASHRSNSLSLGNETPKPLSLTLFVIALHCFYLMNKTFEYVSCMC